MTSAADGRDAVRRSSKGVVSPLEDLGKNNGIIDGYAMVCLAVSKYRQTKIRG